MNLWSTFLDLDKLHESTDDKWWTDQALDELKNKPKSEWTEDDWDTYHYCKNANAERDYYDSLDEDFYDFSPTSTSSWVKMPMANNQAQASQPAKQATVYVVSTRKAADLQQPDFCEFEQGNVWHGAVEYADKLTSGTGHFDSLYDAVAAAKKNNQHFDFFIYEYDASANKLTLVGKVDKAASQPTTPSTNQPARASTSTNKPIVTIVKDSGKLRALAANGDGQGNPAAFVQFPTVLRTNEGQQYEVDQLVWTGKFYRVAGKISPIITNVTASTTSTQNINENINKENSKMNFNSVFEELNKLYENKPAEEAKPEQVEGEVKEAPVEEGCNKKALKENDEFAVFEAESLGEKIKVAKKDFALAKRLDKKASNIWIKETDREADEEYLCKKYGVQDFCGVELFDKFAIAAGLTWDLVEEEALKEAAEEAEIEFAEEPVDVIPEEETEEVAADEEEIPEEDVNTVEEFLNSIGEYDGDLKLEFKPIVIDGKEYSINNILWSDEEEGKLVAEFVVDMPEVEEEVQAEGEQVEESLNKDEKLKELFNVNVGADLSNFGGTGNTVSVLSAGLPEDLDQEKLAEEDEDLDELFDANIKLHAPGFGGSGNNVDVL